MRDIFPPHFSFIVRPTPNYHSVEGLARETNARVQRRQDTILRHVNLTFLIFCLLKNYDDIRIQHGRHLSVDFCHMVYTSTNTIRGA